MMRQASRYDFRKQLAIGERYERQLDAFFCQWPVDIRPATAEEQRRGIDRVFTSRATGSVDTMEYKADDKAGRTGNAFIETVSVDVTGKPGWAVSSQADYLVYLVTRPMTVYLIGMKRLRAALPRWKMKYPTVKAQNDGYCTLGVLVPLDELEKIAILVR